MEQKRPVTCVPQTTVDLRPAPPAAVRIMNGFWADRQRINRRVTLPYQYDQFTESGHFDSLDLNRSIKDPKTRLQEYLQSRNLGLPEYEIKGTSGKQHKQQFYVDCTVEDLSITSSGQGASRRKAEQDAATRALIAIGVENG